MNQAINTYGNDSDKRPVVTEVAEDFTESTALFDVGLFLDNIRALIVITLIGAALGYWYAQSLSPVYVASTTLLLKPAPSNLASIRSGIGLPFTHRRFLETQYEILRSRQLAEQVAQRLDHEAIYSLLYPSGQEHSRLKIVYLDLVALYEDIKEIIINALRKNFQISGPINNIESVPPQIDEVFISEILPGIVSQGMSLSGGKNSELVTLSYRSTNPELATLIINEVAETYIDRGHQERLTKTADAGEWISTQLQELRKKLAEAETNLKNFQIRENLINLASLKRISDSKLQALNTNLTTAEQRYNDLAKRYGDKHPKLIAAKAQLQEARTKLDLASRTSVLSQDKQFELARLEDEMKTTRDLYDVFLTRFNEFDISTDKSLKSAAVLDVALLPTAPISPNKKSITIGWAAMFFILGYMLAYYQARRDSTIKYPEEAEMLLSIPVLGLVPLISKRRPPLQKIAAAKIPPERLYIQDTKSRFAEEINSIRTGVLFSDVDNPPKVILVSSSVQSEGKTTLSMNLAMSLAQLQQTLLIEADLRKPKIKKFTKPATGNGILDYLADRKSLDECIQEDHEVANLSVLGCPSSPANPLEILSSRKFGALIETLREKFQFIVIDSPPIMPVSDPIVISKHVDGILLTIRAGSTSVGTVRAACKKFGTGRNTRFLGCVMSIYDYKLLTRRYRQYRYYGYGHQGYRKYGSYDENIYRYGGYRYGGYGYDESKVETK